MSGPTAGPATLDLPGAEPGLIARLQAGLERVEEVIERRTASEDPFVTEASQHLARAGGKRFRPMLTLLAAELCEGVNDDVVAAAAGVELTHLASLYHDDVMDEAELRRGAQSANSRYGNSTAILVGDLLFGTASDIIADLGPEAVRLQARTFIRLCAGQIRDDRPCPPGEDPAAYYRQVLADKTGVLVATAARYGAMLAGGSPEVVAAVTEYGERLGVAFQLVDDVIDVTSGPEELGKMPGTDLREGKRTLPVLGVLASRDPADAELQELLSGPVAEGPALDRALELLRAHPATAAASAETVAVGRAATEALAPVADSPARRALVALIESVVHRVG